MGGEHEFNYRPFENRHVAHGMEEKVKGACISTYCLRSNASLHFFNSLLGDFLGVFDGVLCFPSSPFLFGVFDGAILATLRLIFSDVLIELLNLKKKIYKLIYWKMPSFYQTEISFIPKHYYRTTIHILHKINKTKH